MFEREAGWTTLRLKSSQVAALSPVQAAVKAPDPRKELLHSSASVRVPPYTATD